MKLLQKLLAASLCLLAAASFLHAQPNGKPVIIGQSFSLKSDILGEERPYLVHIPKDYNESGNPVAVMYLLDGDGHFHHTTGVVTYLAEQGRIPSMMVVAIPNTTDRTRDLTPMIEQDEAGKKNFPTSGGANNMLAFITDELMPHIDQQYHTNSYRILVGHSFGGLFAVNTWLEKPNTFNAYIAISPSMWWDQQNMVKRAEDFLNDAPKLEGFFYMSMGNEGGGMLGGAMKLAALLEEKAPEGFKWDFKVMKEETHGSVPHRSTYYGLEAIFKDWYRADIAALYLAGGMEAIQSHYAKVSKTLGYEMKPSEVDINNLGYQMMGTGKLDKALELFQVNVKKYPSSYNVYDSMAEAYMKMGDHTSAIKHYKKSLEIHPGNANAVVMLKQMGEVVDPMAGMVEVSEKKLKKYVGHYQTPFGKLSLGLDAGKLMLTLVPMVEKEALIPFGNDRFLLKSQNVSILFERNEAQEVVGLEAQMGIGQMMRGEKME